MRKSILLACFTLFIAGAVAAQNNSAKDSLTLRTDSLTLRTDSVISALSNKAGKKIRDSVEKAVRDSVRWARLMPTAIYPVIRNSEMSGAFPVPQVTELPDPKMKYKLLFNLTAWTRDTSSINNLNAGLAEIGRVINLHVAAGVPLSNLEIAIVSHGGAMNVFLQNEAFKKKFNHDNPNLDILKQMIDLKARLMACGQAELFFAIPAHDMIPEVHTAYTAQVVLSTYQLKGFVLYDISNEDK